jgi:hypothetical protein
MKGNIVRISLALAVLASAAVWSCTGDTGPTGPEGPAGATGATGPAGPAGPSGVETFRATLNAASEVATPPVVSTGSATAVITYIGGQLLFRVDVAGTDSVTRAHIHGPAGTTANGPIRVAFHEGVSPGLDFTTNKTLANGVGPFPTGITMDSLLVIMRNGNAYVNVHTVTYPGGELRGQITRP